MEIIPYTGMKNRKFKKRIHNGMFLWTDPAEHIQQQIFWYGFYEKKYVLAWEENINEDCIVLDIGSNIGYYSLVAAGKTTSGHIYAFEADSGNFQMMRENVELNHLKNIEIIPAAVWNENSHKEFFHSGSENKGMSGLSQPENVTSREIVRTLTIDSWVVENHINKIDIIKMDIEGAEYKALLGMRQVLQKLKPLLFIEVSAELLQRHGNTPAQIFELLYSFGYKSYQIKNSKEFVRVDSVIEDELVVFRYSA